ncbi:MAG: FmdB family zinc ribbon protein [Spirochaetota bacterium]|nr:FmdB family zinc ribbon protein [Spirochaetota bacterium]
MPTYEYVCLSCGERFDQFQRMEDAPLEKCPDCRGPVRRLITGGGGFIMKGSNEMSSKAGVPSCGRETPCCGRDIPCGKSEECR